MCVFSAGLSVLFFGFFFFSVLRYLQSILYVAHKIAKSSFPTDILHKLVKKTLQPHEQPAAPFHSYGL